MNLETQILIDAERHVSELITEKNPKTRYFHNLKHTQSVALRCHELAVFYNISRADKMVLHLAAWFHDVGYCTGAEEHELLGAELMRKHLASTLGDDLINQVHHIIMATKFSVPPDGLLQQIICDADMYHLGSENYHVWASLLKKEFEHYHHTNITEEEWTKQNICFFDHHRYVTGYANYHWGIRKEFNRQLMKEKLKHPVKSSAEVRLPNHR